MDDQGGWQLPSSFAEGVDMVIAYLPQLLGALLVLAAGIAAAALLRMITARVLRALERLLPRFWPGVIEPREQSRLPALAGGAVFWIAVLVAAVIAARLLELTLVSSWLDAALATVPALILAVIVLAAGTLLGRLARDVVGDAAAAAGLAYANLAGATAQAGVFIAAVIIGLDLLGLDITFLITLAAVLGSALAGGAALAFGLGAQTLVRNLLGVRGLDPAVQVGDRIRVAGLEGHVAEVGRQAVVLETAAGRVAVPGRYFSERPSTRIMDEPDDG